MSAQVSSFPRLPFPPLMLMQRLLGQAPHLAARNPPQRLAERLHRLNDELPVRPRRQSHHETLRPPWRWHDSVQDLPYGILHIPPFQTPQDLQPPALRPASVQPAPASTVRTASATACNLSR